MGYVKRWLLLALLVISLSVAGCLSGAASFNQDSGPVHMPIEPAPTALPTATAMASPVTCPVPATAPGPTQAATPGALTGPDEQYSRTFEWEYSSVQWSFTANVQKALYDRFKAKPHTQEISYSSYALASEDRSCLADTAMQFRAGGSQYGYSSYDDAMNVIAFVQTLPYVDDHPAGGPRYPLETLVDNCGDCKDKSVLAAALLHEMGYDVVFLKYPGHLAVGINVPAGGASFSYNGALYYYAETTGKGWKIGEVPDELKGQTPVIIPMVKNPEIDLEIAASSVDENGGIVSYRVEYVLHNTGPGAARHLKLQVRALALSKGDNVIWAPEQVVESGDMADGDTIRSDTLLSIPAGEPSRIVCILSGDNVDPVQKSTSDFTSGA